VAKASTRPSRVPGAAFLLSQLGGQSARAWAARLAAIGMEPREVMLFRHVARSEGRSQQELATSIGLPPSRIVGLVDRLEAKGWVERRTRGADRRRRELHTTALGRSTLEAIMKVAAEHEAAMTRALDTEERELLIGLLDKIAAAEGLIEGVHPGFADPDADQSRTADPDLAGGVRHGAKKRPS
jgi:DNA-binding MarR family transcriptional regulator